MQEIDTPHLGRFGRTVPPAPLPALAEHWHNIAPATDPAVLARLADFYASACGAHPLSTQRAWIGDSRLFAQWCVEHGRCPLPAAPETVAAFLHDQFFVDGKSLRTVQRYAATLATMHRDGAGLENPCQTRAVQHKLKELRGSAVAQPPRQAAPLRWRGIAVALDHLGDRPLDLLSKALACVAYDVLARCSDVREMRIEDVAIHPDGSGLLRMRRVKNRDQNDWKQKYLHPTTVRHLRAWLDWLATLGITDGWMFRGIYKTGKRPVQLSERISDEGITRALRRVARAAGIDRTAISGHSCRVGCAQDLLAAGISMPKLLRAGDWKSERMPLRYAEGINEQEGGVAEAAVRLGR